RPPDHIEGGRQLHRGRRRPPPPYRRAVHRARYLTPHRGTGPPAAAVPERKVQAVCRASPHRADGPLRVGCRDFPLAAALVAELGRTVDYRPVETDGAARAASLIAELI